MVAPLVPPQHETVNPVRPGREQPQRWIWVPEIRWWGHPQFSFPLFVLPALVSSSERTSVLELNAFFAAVDGT